MLSNVVNEKNVYMFSYAFQKLFGSVLSNCSNANKNTFGMRNTPYSIELSVQFNQPSVLNTTYTIQCRVNCPIYLFTLCKITQHLKQYIGVPMFKQRTIHTRT